MKVEFGPDFEDSLKRLAWFERTRYINPKQIAREIKWFWQRGRRGYSDQDLWGAYHHIATTVIAYTDFQKKYGMGYPMGLKNEKQWHKILDEIAWYMNEVREDTDTPVEVITSARYQTRLKKANALFAKYWLNMWD